MAEIYDRRAGKMFTGGTYGQSGLRLAYSSRLGRVIVGGLITRRWFSRLATWPARSRASRRQIPEFVTRLGIDESEFAKTEFASFADFFVRDLKPGARPLDPDPARLIAPADSKLTVYPIAEDLTVSIKGYDYGVAELVGGAERLAGVEMVGGAGTGGETEAVGRAEVFPWTHCLVFRLSVDDFHRYCFIDDCRIGSTYALGGRLHTVGEWSDGRARILAENHRVVTFLSTARFGQVAVIEVGALLVGQIINHQLAEAARGQEKGYFGYGGSTIVVLIGGVEIDPDITEQSERGIETRVRRGEGIGKWDRGTV